MEKGRVTNFDAPRDSIWSIYEPEVVTVTGLKLLRGTEGNRLKAAFARVKASCATIHAYRCPKCGYVELNAQQNSIRAQ